MPLTYCIMIGHNYLKRNKSNKMLDILDVNDKNIINVRNLFGHDKESINLGTLNTHLNEYYKKDGSVISTGNLI